MPLANRKQLRELSNEQRYPAVSIYCTLRPAQDGRSEEETTLHELLREVREGLEQAGVSAEQVEELMEPAGLLADGIARSPVLGQERSDDTRPAAGLAVFAAPGFFRWFHTSLPFARRWYVGTHFQLLPIVALLQPNRRCFLLELTPALARLHSATQYGMFEIPLPEDVRTVQGGTTPEDLLDHCRRVDRAVCAALQGQNSPLMLASVGYLASLYETVNSYRYLVREKVPGDPQRWTQAELMRAGWQRIQPFFERERKRILAAYQGAKKQRRTSGDPNEVLAAARRGKTQCLLLSHEVVEQGLVARREEGDNGPPSSGDGAPARSPESLLSEAAQLTLRAGGDVYVLQQMPEPSPIVGILRP